MEKYPKPISKYCTQKILDQMNNSFFKIKHNKGNTEIGFFCIIKNDDLIIPVLIADINILNIINNNTIEVFINNTKQKIELDEIIFKDKKQEIVIIALKEKLNNNIIMLEIDENLFERDIEIFYPQESIYIIYYDNEEKDISISYGIINNINNSNMEYSCNIKSNSKICPIFNLSNNKIIGLHKDFSIYYNKGIIL